MTFADLVVFLASGTGDTIPYICQNASAVVPVHSHADASDVAPGMIFTDRYVLAQTCLQEQAEYGELVGTAFTARDLMRIVDALGEDGLLRFWGELPLSDRILYWYLFSLNPETGISYGSALGAAAAAMFPDRMDRVVLDAVLNQHQYWEGLDYEQPAKADGALHLFCEACIEGGETCILSQYASTADELERKIYDLFDSVRHQPLALGPTNAAVVRYDMLKTNVVTGLRIPTALWQINAMMLDSIFTPNATMYQETTAILTGLFDGEEESWPELGIEGGCGIRCSDSSFRSNSLEDLYPVIEGYQNVSKLAGAFLVGPGPMTCSQWPFEAKERVEWTGGYETRHPLLFVGNTYDPLTPVDSAYNASADFPGSAVVEQNSSGVSAAPLTMSGSGLVSCLTVDVGTNTSFSIISTHPSIILPRARPMSSGTISSTAPSRRRA